MQSDVFEILRKINVAQITKRNYNKVVKLEVATIVYIKTKLNKILTCHKQISTICVAKQLNGRKS